MDVKSELKKVYTNRYEIMFGLVHGIEHLYKDTVDEVLKAI